MAYKIGIFWLVVSLLLAATVTGQSEKKSELRGLWVTRFEWPDENPELCKKNIVEVFKNMERAHFNVAYFQVRGAAEVLYPSSLEPWSPLIGGKNPGFDPLKFAIDQAHLRRIELHAYINLMPLYLRKSALPPKNPKHLYYRHGPNTKNPWICFDDKGKEMQVPQGDYYYLSPGIPEVQVYLRRIIMDLVRRYDIDGIHLDRIRYPGKQYSHDPISTRRFLGRGNPDLKEWGDWQRDQLDKFVNDLYAEIIAEKPDIVISCAAWGIYDRYHVQGYQNFSSGYHDYCQDTWEWIDSGAMDLLIPMIYWDMADPKPNYQEMLDDFLKGVGLMHIIPGQRMYGNIWPVEENLRQIAITRKRQAMGNVIFSYRSARDKNAFAQIKHKYYQNKVTVPILPWKKKSEYGMILGLAVDKEGKPLEDAWVSIKPNATTSLYDKEGVFARTWTTSADGRFAFLKVPPLSVTITVCYPGATSCRENLIVQAGEVKRVQMVIEGGEKARKRPFLIVITPGEKLETAKKVLHVLGRTNPDNEVLVGGVKAEVFATGAFARDNIPLHLGENRIEVIAKSPDGIEEIRMITAICQRSTAGVTKKSVAPAIESWSQVRIGEVISNAGILAGLHYVRLGGPYLAEVAKKTRLYVVGKCGEYLQVRLSSSLTGWIKAKDVTLLAKDTPRPHGFFTYVTSSGNENYDILKIPISEPIAYCIRCETGMKNALVIDFYNSHWAATWLIHKTTAKMVNMVTGEQLEDGHCRLRISLKSKQVWGYWSERDDQGITIFIKRSPTIAAAPYSSVNGLVIALEAGHGGRKNLGAHGAIGTYEKSVNAMAVERLQEALESRGATVVLLRPGDSSPCLSERVKTARNANVDLIISVHANAVDTANGFLRISGTSVYYKHIFCRPLAQAIYRRMRELGWDDYGLIGNFNYLPLRATFAPAILVEQAFLSNPRDEARLLSSEYQEKQAQAIVHGIEDFIAGE